MKQIIKSLDFCSLSPKMLQLPRELWIMILKQKTKNAWKIRKEAIQYLLMKNILPTQEHYTDFQFHNYSVWYYRTDHVDITIQRKNGDNFSLRYVLNVQVKSAKLVNCVRMRFVYCPTYTIV